MQVHNYYVDGINKERNYWYNDRKIYKERNIGIIIRTIKCLSSAILYLP